MGAWQYLQVTWPLELASRATPEGITRSESASPATGSHAAHKLEQQALIALAFGDRESLRA
jgi:2-oxoglutarate dehydrogenase E1 component